MFAFAIDCYAGGSHEFNKKVHHFDLSMITSAAFMNGETAKWAQIFELIKSLPRQFDSVIGDRGIQLSGGERQRVAIARAILRGAEILILDEATSALDSKTEKLIQEAIDEAVTGKTAIVIAHRLSTIRRADKIVVIEDGKVVEEGSLEYLLANKKVFSGYWEEQKFC